ncbi:MAG: tetratricopeptide repeat protein [Planctomycetaceae bacterium]
MGWGWGWPGFGWGLGFGLASLLFGGYGYGGYGGGYGYSPGYYNYDPYCNYANVAYVDDSYLNSGYGGYAGSTGPVVTNTPQQQDQLAQAQPPAADSSPPVSDDAAANAQVFAEKGETEFKARDYKGAVYAWRHALVDDPQNGVLTMMIGQALFAAGQYDEAAGATQAAMQLLPKEQWGVVVKNYKELYASSQDYTDQLRSLEKAVKDKPKEPALRFLAGFHYAYLGYPKEAIDQLDKGLKLAPRDEAAKRLRDEMQAKLPKSSTPPVPDPSLDRIESVPKALEKPSV